MTMVRNGGYEGTGPPEAHRVVPLKRAASLKALKRQYLEIYHRECLFLRPYSESSSHFRSYGDLNFLPLIITPTLFSAD